MHPHHHQFILNGLGNVYNHLDLYKRKTKYFQLQIYKTKIANLTIQYTSQDIQFINYLMDLHDPIIKRRIVIYDPDINVLSKYEDKLLILHYLFSDLEIKATNDLFELNELLHINNKQIFL